MTYQYHAIVVKVIDGDTVDLVVDLGFHVSIAIRTRLIGIDAPEVSTPAGKLVRDTLRGMLPIGTAVTVQTEKHPGDKYGRWLARIGTPFGDLAEWLVAGGMAAVYEVKS